MYATLRAGAMTLMALLPNVAFASAASLCEVRLHIQRYIDQEVTIQGIVVSRQHGTYLEPTKKCRKLGGIALDGMDHIAYRAAGGTKEHGILASVTGKLSMSHRRRPRSTLTEYPVIVAMHIEYDQRRPAK